MERAAISNSQIGSDIGLDYTTVSRIRSGQRLPSIDVMVEIERVFKWPVAEQVDARTKDCYAEAFEKRLVDQFGWVDHDASTPA
jgi:ribosome-binding protein aMBF1 (putative translation factor)